MVPCPVFPWDGSPGSTPFPSICKLSAAFLRSSLVFARSLQHFWLPASHLLGACYLLDDIRSTHTPSKYLRATYSHIYMCYVSTSYLLHIYIYVCAYTYRYIHIHLSIHLSTYLSVYLSIHPSIYPSIYLSIDLSIYLSFYLYIYIYTSVYTCRYI